MAPAITLPSKVAEATRTLPQAITKVLSGRQSTTTVITQEPSDNSDSSSSSPNLSGGAIAGIVIGSIAGLLLLLWIIRSCTNMGKSNSWGRTFEPDHEKPPPRSSQYRGDYPYHQETHHPRRSHSRHSHHHHHSRSPRRVEVVQPVVYDSRSRSPRAPPAAYYAGRASSDRRRRSGDARNYRY
ncbi:hypothetical protein F5B22DRAFT_499792 [Xylaria bambusicola]|uniref:uncharacterized protein n=1 Tax=Xylaria bambusicola TaxID=326684 RepID=UPI002007BB27|nr:uncharacterized protein F5B22DRAFT_499792 [Xylaria bambusicola]KAI0505706.1 hypothetical protein F5B22DRAFT_499792 [Xylaria bambusicola]